jgi:acetyl esterase/lipase
MRQILALTAFVLSVSTGANAQQFEFPPVTSVPTPAEPNAIALYPGAAPGSEGTSQAEIWESGLLGPSNRTVRNVTKPSITPYLPPAATATGAAMIVAPGGGFMMLSIDHEGYQVAQWLADHGVAAFVLKYRLNPTPADTKEFLGQLKALLLNMGTPETGPPQTPAGAFADAKAAIALVRSRSKEWGVDPARVGFMGFSAGADATLSVGLLTDPAVRPDFIAPIYGPMRHQTVPADAPPMFAAIAADDPTFGGGQAELFSDWVAAKRPAELHVFERGGHGFGMITTNTTSDHWIQELQWWLEARGYLKTTK